MVIQRAPLHHLAIDLHPASAQNRQISAEGSLKRLDMKTIRWGMIGCGDVTERKSGPGFAKAASSELIAVMRRNGALAEDYARRHGVPRWHDDADAIIHAPDIDAVYVATLTDSHCEYTL